jgi:hypothetical protein
MNGRGKEREGRKKSREIGKEKEKETGDRKERN